MGFIGSLLSNSQGAGFQGSNTNIVQPVSQGVAQQGLGYQNAFAQALAGQNGIGNQQSVFSQQQGLANQIQGVANGTGPNPALDQLNQTTGANIASQAALMGGQRGASANAGLLARQIGQQGANIQQQAVGQGATMQAQQQIAAMQALQGQQQALGNTAQNQVGNTQAGLQGYNSTLGNYVGNQNQSNVGMQSNINNAGATIAQGNQQEQAGIFNGGLQALGGIAGLGGAGQALGTVGKTAAAAHGGMIGTDVQMKSDGGGIQDLIGPAMQLAPLLLNQGGQPQGPGPHSFVGKYLKGGQVAGKAKVQGDSPKNDTVPTMLSPGEIVVPRSHSGDPDKAAAFARAVAMKNMKGKN